MWYAMAEQTPVPSDGVGPAFKPNSPELLAGKAPTPDFFLEQYAKPDWVAPWDIGRAQPSLVQAEEEGLFKEKVPNITYLLTWPSARITKTSSASRNEDIICSADALQISMQHSTSILLILLAILTGTGCGLWPGRQCHLPGFSRSRGHGGGLVPTCARQVKTAIDWIL